MKKCKSGIYSRDFFHMSGQKETPFRCEIEHASGELGTVCHDLTLFAVGSFEDQEWIARFDST